MTTATEIVAYCSTRPGLAIGFPVFVAARESGIDGAMSHSDLLIFQGLGLVKNVIPFVFRGEIHGTCLVTDLGREVAALLNADV